MQEPLSAGELLPHVQALADRIGPRPAGHVQEYRARQYVRGVLHTLGYAEIEIVPFRTPDTWGYALGYPLLLALASNALGSKRRRWGRLIGGLLALGSGVALWEATRIGKQPLDALAPRRPSATLIVRVPLASTPRRKLVLLAHTDSNKHRLSFAPAGKRMLLGMTTAGLGATVSNGVAQLAAGLGAGRGAERARRWSAWAIAAGLLVVLADEQGPYVDGANDNASAVACVLGLAAQLQAHPLAHTEVWLAFTGAEEVGCLGAHALLDAYGEELRDAWFLDFEMVGTPEIAYVTRHTGFSLLSAYCPDAESLAWATATARRHSELSITGRNLVIGEEVGALRRRGYRGLCLVGVGADGWLANWHRTTDTSAHLDPAGLEKAARFAWAMMQELDSQEMTS